MIPAAPTQGLVSSLPSSQVSSGSSTLVNISLCLLVLSDPSSSSMTPNFYDHNHL